MRRRDNGADEPPAFDIVIRNGSIVDGTGAPRRLADIGINGKLIAAIGDLSAAHGHAEVDATGKIVTPGFIDLHTHMDGQVTWDPLISPVSSHGVTTIVMGNCGVGFAPVRADRRAWLIDLMEGVEDIPGTALHQGIRWDWETFPEYLDAVDAAPKLIDVAALVPHAPVRAYVMGERGARNEAATPTDIAEMAAVVRDGLAAGALGVSTAHTMLIKSADGSFVPGALAHFDELAGIAAPLRELGSGIFQCMPAGTSVPEPALEGRSTCYETEWEWMYRIARLTDRPVTFTHVQSSYDPTAWRRGLDFCARAAADGVRLHPQIHPRGPGFIVSLQTIHPFQYTPTYLALADASPAVTAARMREPRTKIAILDEIRSSGPAKLIPSIPLSHDLLSRLFPLDGAMNYEGSRATTPAAIAERSGGDPLSVLYDMLSAEDGERMMYLPLVNYHAYNYDAVAEMLMADCSIVGLSDAGAHCGVMCDASNTTFLLAYWTRDRADDRLSLETGVRKITSEPARLLGLDDRGVLMPGAKADLNVIDYDALKLCVPEIVRDLPASAHRLVQGAVGYDLTMVSGEIVMRQGRETGRRPGRLVRGEQRLPTLTHG